MPASEPLLEGVPLSVLFAKAQGLVHGPETDESAGPQNKMGECLILLNECATRIRQLALFSPNEDMEDVSTTNLKYLLVPYMQADLAHRLPVLKRAGSEADSAEDRESVRLPYLTPSPEEMARTRAETLNSVLRFLEEFLGSCDRLGLLSKEERLSLLGSLDSSDSLDAATRRSVKIARFKKEKELSLRLEVLKARRDAARRLSLRQGQEARAGRKVGKDESDSASEAEGQGQGEDGDVDEAEERTLWVAELQAAWVKAVELELTVKREREMLGDAEKASQGRGLSSVAGQPLTREQLDKNLKDREASHRRAAAAAEVELKAGVVNPAAITCAVLAQDVIEGRAGPSDVAGHKHTTLPLAFGPVSLMNGNPGNAGSLSSLAARQAAAARVFQPSHSLPSMSIEEAGLREMQMMDAWKERVRKEMEEQGMQVKENGSAVGVPKGGVSEGGNDEEEEEEDKESDAAVMKARNWDDWKDENPRGKGNTKLTPCG